MNTSTITLPESLTFEHVSTFLPRLHWVKYAERYLIDGSKMKYFEPGGMLLCALGLKRFLARRMEVNTRFEYRGDAFGYPGVMGFYQTLGRKQGKGPGESPGSSQYLPITELKINVLQNRAATSQIGPEIEKEAARLAGLLLQNGNGPIFSQVAYSITEMMRNVVEHSRAQSIWYAGQYWPNKDSVQIVILDEGVGIRRSLARNPNCRVSTDKEALTLALKPGITGTPPPSEEDSFHGTETDIWSNAGFGLHIVSRLCAKLGKFSIVSGDAGLIEKSDNQNSINSFFQGTVIQMHLKTTTAETIQEIIPQIVRASKNLKTFMPA